MKIAIVATLIASASAFSVPKAAFTQVSEQKSMCARGWRLESFRLARGRRVPTRAPVLFG
jgi:hypothetical protein